MEISVSILQARLVHIHESLPFHSLPHLLHLISFLNVRSALTTFQIDDKQMIVRNLFKIYNSASLWCRSRRKFTTVYINASVHFEKSKVTICCICLESSGDQTLGGSIFTQRRVCLRRAGGNRANSKTN